MWWDDVSEDAFHSLTFNDQRTQIVDWVVHEVATEFVPSTTPTADQQHYITYLGANFSADEPAPQATSTVLEELPEFELFDPVITHTVSFDFTKTE